jgi:hypothetical protein
VEIAMLEELLRKLDLILEDEEMDYLEKMKLQFEIKDLIAAEELKKFLEQ